MKEVDKRKLFIHYMENVNYIENENIGAKKITMSKIERCLVAIMLACIALMTIWEATKEIIMKLRF